MNIVWTKEEKDYLNSIVKGRSYVEITHLMNQNLGRTFTVGQIKGAIKRYRLNTGRTGRFEKGHVPVNKGRKGYCAPGSEKGWYKEGHVPPNRREIGEERVDRDGYVYVKIQDGCKNKNWKMKHVLAWEEVNGPVPSGHAILFLDGDKNNCDISNLKLVSRTQLVRLNQNNLIKSDPELTKTGIIIADLITKTNERSK